MTEFVVARVHLAAQHQDFLPVPELVAGVPGSTPEGVVEALVELVRQEHALGVPFSSVIVIDPTTGFPPEPVLRLLQHLAGWPEAGPGLTNVIAHEAVAVHNRWCGHAAQAPHEVECSACNGTGEDPACCHCGGAGCPQCWCITCDGTGKVMGA